MPLPRSYLETILTPAASRNIEARWSYAARENGTSIILPDGRCDLILRYRIDNPHDVTPVLTGPATRPYTLEYSAGDAWIGLRFRPGNGRRLWGARFDEALDSGLRGENLLKHLPALRPLLHSAKTQTDLMGILNTVERDLPVDPAPRSVRRALGFLHATGGQIRVQTLANALSCSARQLQRGLVAHIGIGAKTYGNIVRFHRALRLITVGNLPLGATAFEAGYADQAHMSREFRRFGGFTPAQIPANLSLPNIPQM